MKIRPFNRPTLRHFGFIIAVTALTSFLEPARAASNTWAGGGGGTWDTGATANWSNGVWTLDDDAVFNNGAAITGTLAGLIQANSLTQNVNGTALTLTSGTLQLDGTAGVTNNSTSALTINSRLVLNNAVAVNAASGAITVGGVISGSGFGITKSGTGTLTLSGANTFSGGVTISSGLVSLGASSNTVTSGTLSAGSLGTGTVTLAGGKLDLAGPGQQIVLNNIFVSSGTSTITNSSGGTINRLGIVGSGLTVAQTVSGSGTLVLSASTGNMSIREINWSGFTGTMRVDSGTMFASNSSSNDLSNATLNMNGGTWAPTNAAGVNQTVKIGTLIGTSTLTTDGGGGGTTITTYEIGNLGVSSTFSGTITNGGSGTIVKKVGTGTLKLTGANTYAGGTTISAGTLQIGDNTTTGALSTSGTITNNGVLAFNRSNAVTQGTDFSTVAITGSGAVTQLGSGTLTLTAANTYSGATNINNGTLLVSGSGAINSSSGITISGSGAKFVQTSSTASTPAITLTQGTLDGTTTVGAVSVGSSGTASSKVVANGNGVSNTALTLGSLVFNGTGMTSLRLPGGATTTSPGLAVTGAFTLSGGAGSVTVSITPSSALTSGSTYQLISYGGAFTGNAATGFTLASGVISGRQAGVFASTAASNGFITLAVSGDAPVWTGANGSAWVEYAVNTATTGTPNFALKTSHTATDFWTGDAVEFNDTYQIGGTPTNVTQTTVDIAAGAANANGVAALSVTFNNSAVDYTINSTTGNGITAGALSKSGTGAVTLNTANTYSGGTTLNAGKLNINNASAIGSGLLTINGGTIDNTSGSAQTLSTNNTQAWNGNFTFGGSNALNLGTGAVTLGASRTVTVNGAGALTVGGVISGSGFGITKSGTGTLTLSGSNTYSGGTTINSGTVDMTLTSTAIVTSGTLISGALGTGTITLAGGTLLSSQNNHPNNIVALANTTSTISSSGFARMGWNNNTLKPTFSGSGTVNLAGPGVSYRNYDWIGFTGTLNNISGNNFIIDGAGNVNLSNATLSMAGGSVLSVNSAVVSGAPTTQTINIGELKGAGGTLQADNNTTANFNIGYLNTSSTYSGIFATGLGVSVSVTKVGTGTLTLAGVNTYTGLTDVQNGTLQFGQPDASVVTLTGGLTVETSGTAVLTAHTGGAANVKVLDLSALTISGTTPFAGGGGKDFGGLASPAPVPEPGTIGLLAVGAIGGLLLRRRSRKISIIG